jgi:hypothetical protein
MPRDIAAIRPPSAQRLFWTGPFALAAMAAMAAAAWWYFAAVPRLRSTKPKSARPLAVIVSGDTAGWIVPCGCTSKQAGGLLRRASYVEGARGEADVVLADVGGAPGGTSDYERVKFLAILRGEQAMRIAAHNLGAAEVALGTDFIRKSAADTGVPFVSSNVRNSTGTRLTEPLRIVEAGGRRVALAGVLSPALAPAGANVDDPRESLLSVLRDYKGQFDVFVVLAYLPADELEALAAALPEADLVVGGPTRQSIAPRASGPTVLAAVTNKGKFLADLRMSPGEKTFSGSIAELGPEWDDDAGQKANLDRYRSDLARLDFPAERSGLVASLPSDLPSDYRIAGTQECRRCHVDACERWDATSHATAWETLVAHDAHYDPSCQHCHTTGYGLPGGFVSVATANDTRGVGCESCHGPSLAHVGRPSVKTLYAAADRCVTCHDRENSPQFEYAVYWETIEHGGSEEPPAQSAEP